MPIRAILFDKDGTLVDFQRTWGPATQAVLTHFAGSDRAVFDELAAVSGFIAAEQRFLPDSPIIAGATPDFGTLWAKVLGRPATADFFVEIDRLYYVTGLDHLVAIGDPAGVLAVLRRRGYRLGIATNDPEASAHAQAARLGIAPLVEFIAGYDSGFGAKPAAGPVLAFARAIAVEPREVAVVGDAVHDLAAARAAGAVAIGVRSGPTPGELLAPHADALIDSIADLPAWLAGR
jgi:phosphoglycolate phosphatase